MIYGQYFLHVKDELSLGVKHDASWLHKAHHSYMKPVDNIVLQP